MVGARAQGRSKFRNVCRIFVVSNAYKKKNAVFEEGSLLGVRSRWFSAITVPLSMCERVQAFLGALPGVRYTKHWLFSHV